MSIDVELLGEGFSDIEDEEEAPARAQGERTWLRPGSIQPLLSTLCKCYQSCRNPGRVGQVGYPGERSEEQRKEESPTSAPSMRTLLQLHM